jgi:phosphosulfolactate phosphohydrolase-like enzyme
LNTSSPEADAAVTLFERHREALVATLQHCGSGRELEERGHEKDKAIAGQLDVSPCVPRFDGLTFVATAPFETSQGASQA